MRRAAYLPAIAIGLAAVVAIALPASAEDKTYSFSGFEKIDASAGVSVILKQGPYAVSASGDAKALERLEIKTSGKTLEIGRKSNLMNWGSSGRVTVTVSSPTYSGVAASSGSSVDGAGLTATSAADFSVSSGANLKLTALKLGDAKISVSSGSRADFSGSCSSVRITVSSGANFDGADLKCESAVANASSGASADIWASKSGDGNASSGASVTFLGATASQTRDTSSGGSVKFK